MNPFEIFDSEENKKINNVAGILENRNYTKEEWNKMGNSILEDIMSKNSKNGDIAKARNELDKVISKIEKYRG